MKAVRCTKHGGKCLRGVAMTDQWRRLRQALDAKSHLLLKQGTVVEKYKRTRRYWVLRYYEIVGSARVQRTLYIGADRALVRKVRRYLGRLRQGPHRIRETAALASLGASLVRGFLKFRRKASFLSPL